MGSCVSHDPNNHNNKGHHQNEVEVKKSKFSKVEQEIISKMYADLACRSKINIVTRENFQVFFHASGLMAELLFTKFDQNKCGQIAFNQFLNAFEVMVKGSFVQKADVLFEFYGIQNSGGIRYSELLKILFSYPLEDLNRMLTEENFLKYLGDNMLTYYFGPEKKIEDKTIIDESQQGGNDQPRKLSVYSVYAPTSHELIDLQSRIKDIVAENSKNKKIDLPQIFKKDRPAVITHQMNEQNKIGSTTQIQMKKNRKAPQLKSNIASITKRYATYLFVSLNLDKQKDVFLKDHFYKLLQDHPSIFDAYLSGFHTYIWQLDSEGTPEFNKCTPWIEGNARQVCLNKEDKIYLKFIRTTIFIFNHKVSRIPKDIINLEGLIAESVDKVDAFGIKFRHRQGFYPEREYLFESLIQRQDWLKQLSDFKENAIADNFLKLQRIGGGSYSNVYRGKDKKTDKFVAIKVIEPLKLKQFDRQVLKRQCGILKMCHHPNIVKFIKQFKTKTHLYIVTQLLLEGDLFQYTRKNCFLEEYEAAIIFKQLADTIIYLNELGIIHRDLKPQNVMIIMNQDKKMIKRVKLIDFGFGVFKDKLKDLPESEKYAGTPGFIAPEVYQNKDYDEKIDTFSLGIILYFMLYGYLPFQSNYTEEIQEMTLNCNITLVNNHWSNVSFQAKDLILKILTPPSTRITTKQVIQHPWLQNIERLKQYQGRNKKTRILF